MIKIIQRAVLVLTALAAVLMVAAAVRSTGLNDTDGPEIVMEEDSITADIGCTDEELLAGITATDKKDGDVTDTLVVEGMSNFIEKGRRTVTVAAFDQDNNVTKATREVVYNNYTSPRFSLESPLLFAMNNDLDLTSVFQITDCLDGDLSGDVVITVDNYIDYSMAGAYKVTFQVSNSAGDVVELPATVELYDALEGGQSPRAVLSEYLVYVPVGSEIDPMDYVVGVTAGGRSWEAGETGSPYSMGMIEVSNPVDTSVPGVYEIGYTIPYEEGYQPTVRMIVIVE